ncbi:hypothetical protein [Hymenobacter properus]|uniref:Uncharacterized protein n=1 Tax=Hymenobacter properus TaxID=2791026 RepID=A0A931FLR7_9BACT|nr:hypothetical protein [Hymenobacter properus]MBF9142306.1 hypothetical protein [Hymenobacter properus]MBR7721113.1 hypothetical protein [Microvirga sp. SRT04]
MKRKMLSVLSGALLCSSLTVFSACTASENADSSGSTTPRTTGGTTSASDINGTPAGSASPRGTTTDGTTSGTTTTGTTTSGTTTSGTTTSGTTTSGSTT